jgi:hypothetical protein
VTAPPRPRPPRRRRRRIPPWIRSALLVTLVFLLGVALGMALHDNPKPGGTQTLVRTYVP